MIYKEIINSQMAKVICNSWYWLNGTKQCGFINGCRMTGDIECGLNEPESSLMGWECPRCHKIHSPFIPACDCPPQTITSSTINS